MTSPAIDPTGAAQLIAEQHAREVSGDREAARGTLARALLVRVRLVREGVLTAGEGADGCEEPALYLLRGRQQPAPVEDFGAGDR
ncbi:hypothetical protein [Streptomyces antimycoticus]|uniref:hypothetical protein n=1 Tax=Streptomyces antimycoticus TaxID=68175 RepID=UPI0033EA74DF